MTFVGSEIARTGGLTGFAETSGSCFWTVGPGLAGPFSSASTITLARLLLSAAAVASIERRSVLGMRREIRVVSITNTNVSRSLCWHPINQTDPAAPIGKDGDQRGNLDGYDHLRGFELREHRWALRSLTPLDYGMKRVMAEQKDTSRRYSDGTLVFPLSRRTWGAGSGSGDLGPRLWTLSPELRPPVKRCHLLRHPQFQARSLCR